MKITVYRERGGGWRWRLNDGTRTELAQCGEKYRERNGAERAAAAFAGRMSLPLEVTRKDGYQTVYVVKLGDSCSP